MAHRDRHGEVLVNEHATAYAERGHLYAFLAVAGLSVDIVVHHHQVVAVARGTLALGDAFQHVDRRLQRVPYVADRPLDKDGAVSGNRFRPSIYPGLLVGLRAVIVPAYAESAHNAHAERLGHIRIGLKLLLELLVRPLLLLGILCTEHFPYQRGGQVDHREPESGDYGIFPFTIVNFHIERIRHFHLSNDLGKCLGYFGLLGNRGRIIALVTEFTGFFKFLVKLRIILLYFCKYILFKLRGCILHGIKKQMAKRSHVIRQVDQFFSSMSMHPILQHNFSYS